MSTKGCGRPIEVRFSEKVSPEPNTGCWLWIGALNNRGYGVINTGNDSTMYAHRLSLGLARGKPLDRGECALHRCDNPCCVNPAHLFVGTIKDNVHDMLAKGRARGWPKGRPFPREVVERRSETVRAKRRMAA